MYNQEVVFRGFCRNNVIINNEMNRNHTDWHSMHFVMPYVNKRCRVIGQNQDGSIQCEFQNCDMDGNIIHNGITAELSFEFAEYSDGLINYDPFFERVDEQPNIIIGNPPYQDIILNDDAPINNNNINIPINDNVNIFNYLNDNAIN